MTNDQTLGDIGEFALIDLIGDVFAGSGNSGASVVLGVGDDAAVLAVPGRVVVAVDQMVEGRHFRRDWSSAHDVGRKAVARSMSDIAAMGARPVALLIGLAAPATLPVAWACELAEGMVAEASMVGAAVVGGDTVASDTLVLSVTALGDPQGREPITRAGARPGDVVALAGVLGRAAAGLAVLSRGHRQPKSVVAAQRTPAPPYAAGIAAAEAGATAMIDVSDGLLADAGHLARASGVVIDVHREAIGGDAEIEMMARNLGADVWEWVLCGGEDHALVATFPPSADLPDEFRQIGTVAADAGDGGMVTVDGAPMPGRGGHEHFQ